MLWFEQIMLVLLDVEDMCFIYCVWLVDMCFGVCFMLSGDCQFMLFYQDESLGFLDWLKDYFGLCVLEIFIYFKVVGFVIYLMKYLEECVLVNFLFDNFELIEEVLDYFVNFVYVCEEGLDLVNFMGCEVVYLLVVNSVIEDVEFVFVDLFEFIFLMCCKLVFVQKLVCNLYFDFKCEV